MYKKQRKLYTFLFHAQESGVFCARYFFMYKKSNSIVHIILYLCFAHLRKSIIERGVHFVDFFFDFYSFKKPYS